jgi:hypothetical protein
MPRQRVVTAAHTVGALRDQRNAAESGPRRAVRERLRPRDVDALRPLIDYRTRAWPSRLTSAHPYALDVLAEERAAGLAAEVAAGVRHGRLPADAWAPVLKAPERWLRGYVAAMNRAWAGLEPHWHARRPASSESWNASPRPPHAAPPVHTS